MDVVRAYNDALSEWARVSDRYLPLAILPYLSDPKIIAREIERAVISGHRGVNVPRQDAEGRFPTSPIPIGIRSGTSARN